MNKKINLQLFAAAENTTITTDIEPAISVDYTTKLAENINSFMELLGITNMIPMAEGTSIKGYKLTKTNTAGQAAEGDTIALTKIDRKLAFEKTLTLKKYRKAVTAEAIQRAGYSNAVNETDAKLISEVQKDIKKDFYTALKTGSGSTTGTNLQTACANLWAALQKRFEDYDASPVYFINPEDVAEYLGTAQITMQTAFGFSYIENFLGLGTAIITAGVDAKAPMATAKENLAGAYIPGSGDLASAFNLTMDATGMVGMNHSATNSNATIETLVMAGVVFWPEYADGVFKATIAPGA